MNTKYLFIYLWHRIWTRDETQSYFIKNYMDTSFDRKLYGYLFYKKIILIPLLLEKKTNEYAILKLFMKVIKRNVKHCQCKEYISELF